MHWLTRAPRHRDERGAAAVEFALVMPILLMILFGVITTGWAVSDYLSATNAVREGSRYGAATNVSTPGWATSVRDRVKSVYYNEGVQVSDDQICVRLIQAAGTTPAGAEYIGANCGPTPDTPTGMAPGSCAVMVWMRRPVAIKLMVFPDITGNIAATSVAYYGREVLPTCTAS